MRRVTAILYLQIFLLPDILCHFKTVTKFSFHNINFFVCNSSYDFYQWSFLYEGHLNFFFFNTSNFEAVCPYFEMKQPQQYLFATF